MRTLCLNWRDQLTIIDLDKVAYFQANGNYVHLVYIGGGTQLLPLGLTALEEYVRRAWPKDVVSPFIRLGRSYIINQTYLSEINVLRQRLVLSDRGEHAFSLSLPKSLLKKYKENINDYYINTQGDQ